MSILMQDHVGAFCRHTHVEVPGRATGPLAGLSCGVKDIYDMAGHKTGFGSPDWFATHAAAQRTACVVQALLDAGARVAGRTHSDELTYSLFGENPHYGAPLNVNAPGRVPGGSSSGSAAAVAAGLVDFALGSDTGGSVRVPASFCGVYGIRPTHGRVSLAGACPLAPSFDTCGWFAREPVLFHKIGEVLLGEVTAASVHRLMIATDAFELVRDAVARALDPALERVAGFFAASHSIRLLEESLLDAHAVFRILQGAEIWAQHGEWVTTVKPILSTGVKERMQWAATIPAADVAAARRRRDMIVRRLQGQLEDHAIIVLPTVPDIAPLLGASGPAIEELRGRMLALLCIASLAGLPQVSLPLAKLDGCPLGVSLIGAPASDASLLDVAMKISCA